MSAATHPGDRRRLARAALGRLDLTLRRCDTEVELIREQVQALIARSYSEEQATKLVLRLAETQTELAAAARAIAVEPHLLLAVQARGSAAQRVARILDDISFEQLRLAALLLKLDVPQREAPSLPPPTRRSCRGRGRPPRGAVVSREFVAAAPFPELATEPADRLPAFIRCLDDPALLLRALVFERQHDRRKTVIGALEQRLRVIDRVASGPATP